MPRDSVADVLGSTKVRQNRFRHITCMVVANIAIHFGVTYQSALFRLQNLGYVSKQEAEKLQMHGKLGIEQLIDQQMPTDGKSMQGKHQSSASHELQIEFAILVIQAFQQEIIFRGKLLELAKLIEIDSRSLLNVAEAIHANSK